AQIVTVDSQVLEVDSTINPDLFWAIRGGSGNFGIVTSLRFALHPVGMVTTGNFTYSLDQARPVLRFYRDFLGTRPYSFHADAGLSAAGKSISIDFFHNGEATDSERLIRPFRSIARPTHETLQRIDYRAFTGTEPLSKQTTPPRAPTGFSMTKGLYLERLSD